jgi:glycosyltransferase involved in cell wall biosynthesis
MYTMVLTPTQANRWTKSPRSIVACIPAYNEEMSIGGVIANVQRHVDTVVVCDDGSNDLTAQVAERMGAYVVHHTTNGGKGSALATLFRKAQDLHAGVVVTLDADGQHDADAIPHLIEPILQGHHDVVVGARWNRDLPLYRRIGLGILNRLTGAVHPGFTQDTQSGFRAFSAKALPVVMEVASQQYGVETEQLARLADSGLNVGEVPVYIRYHGLSNTSKKHPFLHGLQLIRTVIGILTERRPLLLLGVPGVLATLIGLGLFTYLLWLFNAAQYFSLPIAVIGVCALGTGMTLVNAALILFSLQKVADRVSPRTLV